MHMINANDLKTQGISNTCTEEETVVTVRGKPCYVVLTIEKYEKLSEIALSFAVAEAKKDYAEGRYIKESVQQHIKRVTK